MTGPQIAVSLSGVVVLFLPLMAGAVVVLGVLKKIGRP